MTCYAVADRHEPGVMRCSGCGLFWSLDDPVPPGCRARHDEDPSVTDASRPSRPHDFDKSDFTRTA